MANQVNVNLPGVEQGAEVEVVGLGKFLNGETTRLSDEQVRRYQLRHPDHEGDVDLVVPMPKPEPNEQEDTREQVQPSQQVPPPPSPTNEEQEDS